MTASSSMTLMWEAMRLQRPLRRVASFLNTALVFGGDISVAVDAEWLHPFAPAEAGLLQLLFKSPAISAFGFVEEILPFTDVIPTFTLSWVLSTLFPTTPFAKALLPQDEKQKAEGEAAETGETAKKP